jgi:hypothetical protein
MSNGVKVPDQLAAAFDDLIIHDVAVNAAMDRFLTEQRAMAGNHANHGTIGRVALC